MEYFISACTVMAKEQYIQRHDAVCAELHCNMCKEIGGKITQQTVVWPCREIGIDRY